MHKYLVPEVIFGVGALAQLADAIRSVGGERPFVVSDPGVMEAGWTEHAEALARSAGLEVNLWYKLTPNPKDYEVEAGLEALRESGSDVVVAVGGGSCIDAAKAIALLATSKGSILDYVGIDRVKSPLLPMVSVR